MSSAESLDRRARRPLRAAMPGPDFLLSFAFAAAFIALIAIGYFGFRRPGAMPAGNEMSVDRAIFQSINIASLTGFQTTRPIETYNHPAQVLVLGLIVGGSLISMIVGALAVVRLLEMHHSVKRVVVASVVAEVCAILLGAAAMTPNRSLLESAVLASSAFGNCGVVIGDAGTISDKSTHLILLPLAMLGGFGLPVLIELYDWMAHRRHLSSYSRVVLVISGAIYLGGAIAMLLVQIPAQLPKDESFLQIARPAVLSAGAASLNARTAGLPLEYAGAWPRAMQWIVVVLMFVGANPAGTGGGLKTTTLYELGRGARAALLGRAPGRIAGIAIVWLLIYCALIVVTMTLLLRSETALPGDRSLFITVSAVANCGLSLDPISITGDGLHTLSAAMFLGRFLPWMILWWSALTTLEADVAVA